MRIISSFKDYYDGVQRQGYDAQHPYVRKTEVIEIQNNEDFPFGGWVGRGYRSSDEVSLDNCSVIIVAGMPFLRKEITYLQNDGIQRVVCSESFYNADSMEKRVKQLDPDFNKSGTNERWMRWGRRHDLNEHIKELRTFPTPDHKTKAQALCAKYKTPIIEIRYDHPKDGHSNSWKIRGYIVLNPMLNIRGFAHAMDPFTIYQELAMYVSGVLGAPANPMVDVSEKVMVKKKGFDPTYGFRKRPSDKV